MKRKINKPMRAAGALLVATMLTTCMTAGTFAKYTTTDSATDTARVAKFGVTVVANGNLYGKEYVKGGINDSVPTNYTTTGNSASGSVQSISSTASDVVAPGTKSATGMGIALNGTPEVDVNVSYTIKAQNIRLSSGTWLVLVPVKFDTFDQLKEVVDATTSDATKGIYSYADPNYTKLLTATLDDTYKQNFIKTTQYYKVSTYYTSDADYFPVTYKLSGTTTKYTHAGGLSTNSLDSIANLFAQKLSKNDSITDGATNNTSSYYTAAESTSTPTVKANNSIASVIKLEDEVLTWDWAFENTGKDPADTILGDLIAIKHPDTLADDFTGIVVKQSGNTTNFILPVEDTANATTGLSDGDNDYNLTTSFDITVTVTQVD